VKTSRPRNSDRHLSIRLRLVSLLLIPLQVCCFAPRNIWAVMARPAQPLVLRPRICAPTDPTKGIKVNRTVPKVAPAKALNFSKEPKDSDFVSVHVLSEPLVPVGEKTSPGENKALAAAITAFSKSANPEATAPLTGFLITFLNPPGALRFWLT